MKTTVEILMYADVTINECEGETLTEARKDIHDDIQGVVSKLKSSWLENIDFEMIFTSEGEFEYIKKGTGVAV